MSGVIQGLMLGIGAAKDAFFKYVTLLLTGNSIGGGANPPYNSDASTNNFNVTQNGVVRNATFSPFNEGYYSNYFNNESANNSYISIASSASFAYGTGDFTAECWVYMTTTPGSDAGIIEQRPASTNGNYLLIGINSSNQLFIYINSAYRIGPSAGTVMTLNRWNHVAYSRASGTATFYLNGTSIGSWSDTTNYSNQPVGIGYHAFTGSGNKYFPGYISNVRIVKGTSVYNGAFTPSTSPLTAISNTQLLTCQSARFIDNSTNAFTITLSGTPTVASAQPFTLPTANMVYGAAYNPSSGASDYWSVGNNTALDVWVGDFTVECWVWFNGNQGNNMGLVNKATNDGNPGWTAGWCFQVYGNNLTVNTPGDTRLFSTGVAVPTYQWVHCVLVKSGSSVSIFQNGTRTGTITNSNSYSNTTESLTIGTDRYLAATTKLNGYISNVRVVKGTAIYNPSSTTITVPTAPLTAVTNTQLLTLQSSYPAWNNGFLDASTNNFLITRYGNATQGTFTPYGSNWSNYLSGSTDYLYSGTSTSAFNFTGSFCFEAWVFLNAHGTGPSGGYTIFFATQAVNNYFGIYNTAGNTWMTSYDGASVYQQSSGTQFQLNVWNHVAYVRNGTTLTFYLNGTSVYSTSPQSSTFGSTNATERINIGSSPAFYSGNYLINGFISNVRVVNGSAVYTGNFTPSTLPLTTITNTKLLTCQSNRFVDNSGNSFTITANGTPKAQVFSPFSPSTSYSTNVIGGSAYFDGSGDYLSVTDNTVLEAFDDFTIEGWIYLNSTADQVIINKGWDAVSIYSPYLININSGNLLFSASTTGSSWGILNQSIVASVKTGQWYHFAVTRSGTTVRTFGNGALTATNTLSGTLISNAASLTVGVTSAATQPFNGHMTDVRVVKGTAVYTANFTVPTSPLTSITNTSLLLSTTNSGVFDSSMINDLETVGAAQISTSQSKFGGASLYVNAAAANTDYFVTPSTPLCNFSTGEFTIEFWLYPLSISTSWSSGSFATILDTDANSGTGTDWWVVHQQNQSIVFASNSTNILTSSAVLTANTWQHVAIVRSSTTITIYVNGTSAGSTTYSTTVGGTRRLYITTQPGQTRWYKGYIDDLRITKGYARYTANFTAPAAQFPTQ